MKTLPIPILLLFSCIIQAQEQLLSFTAVSENTLLLKFDEGEKNLTNWTEYYIYDAPNEDYFGQIDEAQALIQSNFSITSAEDANYTSPQNPVANYFKSKEQKGLFEYYVYLELPTPMIPGSTYNVAVSNINAALPSYNFTFNVFEFVSESVHVNQVAMIASAEEKYAYVSHWLGKSVSNTSNAEDFTDLEGTTCHVVRVSDGEIIYSGSGENGLQFRLGDAPTGFGGGLANEFWTRSSVWDFNFSEVGTTISTQDDEEYKVVIEGVGSSNPFRITNKAYDEVFKLLAEGLFHQRSGIDRSTPYSNLPKPVDHMPGVDGFEITYSNFRRLDNTQGDNQSFTELPAQATNLINPTNPASWMNSPDEFPWGSGGHFDAGDHDVYTQHLSLPLYVTFAYLMAPDGFYDGQFNIPESDNGIPDLLDEVRWTLDFFRRTKGATGGICGGKETDNYYAPSWNDGSGNSSSEQMWYVYREDPGVSYVFAAAAAQFALALEEAGDPTNEAPIYIAEAIAAYEWANANQESGDFELEVAGFPISGKFPDLPLMASAMLYSVTGEQEYLDYYMDNTSVVDASSDLYVFQQRDEEFATYAFALIPIDKWSNFDSAAQTLQNIQIQAIQNWAYTWGLNDKDDFPFRHISSRFNPPLGGNSSSTPFVFEQLMAYYFSNDPTILSAVLASNDINLGGNPGNWVYITGADAIGAEHYSSDPLHIDNWQYQGENIPGLPLYGLSSASFYYFQSSPPAEEWPHFECNSNARIYLGHSEFTIHQNHAPSLAVYGYLNAILNDNILAASSAGDDTSISAVVYPNPNRGEFSVRRVGTDAELLTVEVFDINGTAIKVNHRAVGNELKISAKGLASGIYLLKISGDKIVTTKRIIIR